MPEEEEILPRVVIISIITFSSYSPDKIKNILIPGRNAYKDLEINKSITIGVVS
jgi:hypothetical protein